MNCATKTARRLAEENLMSWQTEFIACRGGIDFLISFELAGEDGGVISAIVRVPAELQDMLPAELLNLKLKAIFRERWAEYGQVGAYYSTADLVSHETVIDALRAIFHPAKDGVPGEPESPPDHTFSLSGRRLR